jgi:hypothetical protein
MNLKRKRDKSGISVPLIVHFPSPVFLLILFKTQPLRRVNWVPKKPINNPKRKSLWNYPNSIGKFNVITKENIQLPLSEKFKETQLALPYHTV